MLPFLSQNVVLRLSPLDSTVRSRTSNDEASASRWRSPPASSRSEFVMVPRGLASVTNCALMWSGQTCRQTRGDVGSQPIRGVKAGPGNQMPPAPFPEASWCPVATGGRGTNSAIRVGRSAMLEAIHRKSSRASCTPLWRAMRPFDCSESAFCIVLKMCRAPGRAKDIERSSPRVSCQRFLLVRRW